MVFRFFLLLSLSALGFGPPAAAAGDPVARAQAAARTLGLASDPQWLRLGHYRFRAGRPAGEVDDRRFYNAPAGPTDPEAELLATIAAVHAEGADDDEHPYCRFPARREWLRRQLGSAVFDPPARTCALYAEWRAAIPDARLTLVFPAYHLNSPSSMFGHTLLRLDPADLEASSDWLSVAINFGAEVRPEDNSLFYAFKGLTGGYPGFFIVSPYFRKIREYNVDERRDLWEYPLDLRPDEVRFMATHLWELKEMRFDYYFFDENCSYRLLELIEVARPDLDLTTGFGLTAIPVDTVRAIERAGLLAAASYRPSQVTVLERLLDDIPPAQHDWIRRLAADPAAAEGPDFAALEPALRRRLVDAAYRYLRYERNPLPRDAEGARNSYRLLARLNAYPPVAALAPAPPERPERGHGSRRLVAGAGARDGAGFVDLGFRMSFHSLEDPEAGFLRGAQINIASLDLRATRDRLQVRRLDLVDIFSLTPRTALFSPWSWRVFAGLERQPDGARDVLTGHVTGGAGVAVAPIPANMSYLLAGARLERNPGFARTVEPASGLFAGSLQHFGRHTAHLQVEGLRFANGVSRRRAAYVHGLGLGKDLALRLHVQRESAAGRSVAEAGIGVQVFFW